MTTFDTVLVANRGEIACRIIRTLQRLGIRAVAVYSDADRDAKHVGLADVAVRLGPAKASLSYLNPEAILGAARSTGAQAIHPGYGFLSENQAFAQACAAAGVVFIGPSVHALTVMGDKIRSKNHVAESGVPVIPGVSLPGQTDDQLTKAAPDIGYPMLIKPSAGGGGKGMVRVDRPEELAAALVTARRVAAGAFGDDTLLIERFVSTPRHIEVQVLADAHGGVIHLGERECSLQRRHQKVIEEAPSPLLDEATRARIGEAACSAALSVGYTGAGTVEFLVSDAAPDEFFFMEMNTRLQVEHPVTEMITGIDLVEWQVRVAAGEPLAHRQEDIVLTGHAIEARVYAENPERGFLPTTGTVLALREAHGDGIRVDSALIAGLVVSADYDPMLAKVVAWAPDRAGALARLDRALADTLVLGLRTNLEYLRLLVRDKDVAAGRLDTGLIERKLPGLAFRTIDDHVLAAAALFLHRAAWSVPSGADPAWSRPTGWRMGPHVATRYVLATSPTEVVTVAVLGAPGGASVSIDGRTAVPASLGVARSGPVRTPASGGEQSFRVEVAGVSRVFTIAADGARLWIGADGFSVDVVQRTGAETLADELAGLGRVAGAASPDVRSPMPGTVVAVHAASGDRVTVGQAILSVEAMKMEHQLTAATAGIVTVTLKPGDLVKLDQIVATVAGAPDPDAPEPDTATVNADKGAPQ